MSLRDLWRDRFLLYLDVILIAIIGVGSFVLRLELAQFFLDYIPTTLVLVLLALAIKPLIYRRFGLYRRVWAYASIAEMRLIISAVTVASAILTVALLALGELGWFVRVPFTVYAIDWLLTIVAVGGVRFGLRLLTENPQRPVRVPGAERKVLVVGAGDAGALVVRELQKNPQLRLAPVAFVDDDPTKQDHEVHGIPVAGMIADIPVVVRSQPIDEVIVAIPSAPGSVVRQVADVCRANNIPFRTMPGLYELIGGVVSVNRLREVDITDLLRRESVAVDRVRVGASLGGKRVLITGAGGSIASELCRQVARWGPSELVLLGHGENSIFEILIELEESWPSLPIHALIADVRDVERLRQIFNNHRPDVVFHAAAHKHVKMMQMNVEEAITNNIQGTRNVVQVALDTNVDRLVMISTDKAVQPSSVMGATKRMAEMIVLDAANRSGRAFSVVRFGNVLGSRGSVVPLFKRQIAAGGPVTVNHPDIERYFMTIPEAVHLVLQASAMGQGREVFLLNMGQAVRILDLAEDLIRLSGLEPGQDIEIVFTGLRPGDKLSETLWDDGADYEDTSHPDITRLVNEDSISGQQLTQIMDELVSLAREGDVDAVTQMLDDLIPGAAIRSTPPPDLKTIV